jgi:hypothetical protein
VRTPASLAKDPSHPMLVVFPIGLWIFSLICDLIGMSAVTTNVWFTVRLYTMVGGLIGALAAAAPRLIDLLYYKGGAPAVKKIALMAHDDQSYRPRAVCGEYLATHERSGKHEGDIVLWIIGVCMIAVSGWLVAKWCMSTA